MKLKIIVGSIIFAVGIGSLVLYVINLEPPTGHSEIEPEIEFIYTDDLVDYVSPEDQALKDRLTPLQYEITQNDGTEVPFDNEYWDNHEEGIYVDVVSGEPLFSSTEKFDSGTGWPSFLRPLDFDFVVEKTDYKLIYPRTEIRSTIADSHLGHIILDGPESNDYIRYCMNSASMRFVPVADLEEEGLGQYLEMFE